MDPDQAINKSSTQNLPKNLNEQFYIKSKYLILRCNISLLSILKNLKLENLVIYILSQALQWLQYLGT